MLLALPAVRAESDAQRQLSMRLAPSVVKIEAVTRSGTYAFGSGVVVAPQRVVTNCHVTRQAVSIRVVRGAVRDEVIAQRSDIERDLCLLEVPTLAAGGAQLAGNGMLQPRQKVLGIGFTGGVGLRFSAGEVVALHRHAGAHVIQSSNGFTSGASGGGLFDATGALVGILTFRLRGGHAHYYSTPVAWVRELLLRAGPGEAVVPMPGLAFWEREGGAQPPFLMAAALVQRRGWSDLRSLAERWSRSQPDDTEAWRHLATACHLLGRGAQARQALQELERRDPALAREVRQGMDPPEAPAAPTPEGATPVDRQSRIRGVTGPEWFMRAGFATEDSVH
jgi:serine protease Do